MDLRLLKGTRNGFWRELDEIARKACGPP